MLSVLEKFKIDVNANLQIQRIVKGWSTEILLEEKDASTSYFLDVKDGKIDSVRQFEKGSDPDHQTKIVCDREIMQGLFEGRVNAIRANNDGLVEIYGGMSDQVKLDAIAIILWGVC